MGMGLFNLSLDRGRPRRAIWAGHVPQGEAFHFTVLLLRNKLRCISTTDEEMLDALIERRK